jgi:hypothetical protein
MSDNSIKINDNEELDEHEQKPITARELRRKGWELTQQSMALIGMPVPDFIEFQIDGGNQIRITRVAEVDELAYAVATLEEDIGRLVRGEPALVSTGSDIEQLGQDKAALVELQKRAGRSGCLGSTTVIEALFPDIPVKKRTAREKAEIEQWLAIRKEAGLKIDPETAEVDWDYGLDCDPYRVYDEWELPEEFHQVGRQRWARSPGSDIWVHFHDLPDAVREEIWAKYHSQIDFPAGLEGLSDPEDAGMPF